MDNENKLPELTPEENNPGISLIKAEITRSVKAQPDIHDEPDNTETADNAGAPPEEVLLVLEPEQPEGSTRHDGGTAEADKKESGVSGVKAPEAQSHEVRPPAGENSAPEKDAKLSDREVMEHTASIWRYRTVTENGTELHTEFHSKYTKTNGCEVIGARARGKKHKHEGTNCDDWFETAESEGFLIAVVSDGAGSKQLSRIGARVSCEAAVDYLKDSLKKVMEKNPRIKRQLAAEIGGEEFMAACGMLAPLIQNSARAAFDAVITKLGELYSDKTYISSLGRNPTLTDMGATFLAAVAVPLEVNGSRETFVLSAQIGDGCICAIDSKQNSQSCFKLLGEADSGAYSGETDFLSAKTVSEGVIARKTRISRGKSDILMLMSDGVADDYFPAQPMMKRLYLDLCLNGIIPMPGEAGEPGEPQPPEPLKFPSVSPEQQSVALQYSKQLLRDSSDDAMNELWDRRGELKPHSLEAYGISLGERPQDRLLTWIDNYNERGSFDDRTLVVINFNAE